MKCEFCEKILPDNSVSCPYCGCVVRNTMSDKGHTVISIEQQNDIGNYKMSSDYKTPEKSNTDEEEILYGIDMSYQKFAAQKFSSNDSFKPKITNSGNAVIGADGASVGYPLPGSGAAEKNADSRESLQSNIPKKCEFCGTTLPAGAVSCPECGSMVRRVMSDKGNTVISLSQQNEMGNYRMNSDYKASEEKYSEEEIRYGSDMSRSGFAQQKFTSENSYRSVASGKDVVIRADSFRPNSGTYTMKKERSENIPEENRPKKVSLRKTPPKKVSLLKSKITSKKYVNSYVPLYGDEHISSNEEVRRSEEHLKNIAEVPPGLDKNQFMRLNHLHNVRIPYFSAIVILYICMVGMLFWSLFLSAVFSNPYDLINIPPVLIFTYGLQFKINYTCAFSCFLYGLVYSVIGAVFYGNLLGIPIMIAGILAVISTRKFNALWDMYQKTGTVPYTGNRR